MSRAPKTIHGENREIVLVNPSDKTWTKHRFVLWAGSPMGPTYFLVWANHLQDALDEMVDCIADDYPGFLADDSVEEAYREAIASGMSEEEAREKAEMDTTCAGNYGNYLMSEEWGIVVEDPTRVELLELLGRVA